MQKIVLNGSFVTDIIEPNDVDCVLLAPEQEWNDMAVRHELEKGLPFLDITFADALEFEYFVQRFFAEDRRLRSKGMVEVVP